MERYEQSGILLFVQIDHVSGELIGEILEHILAKGAGNVQLIPSITKKGRPGHILLIDVPKEKLSTIEDVLINELGVSGWHCLPTQHVHIGTETVSLKLNFQTPNGTFYAEAKGKRIRDTKNSMVRPEHNCCVSVYRKLRDEYDSKISFSKIVRLIAQVLNGDRSSEIDLRSQKEIPLFDSKNSK